MPSPPMTFDQQQAFANFLREHLPIPEGQKTHHLFAFTQYAATVLKRPRLTHWRALTVEDAQTVMKAAQRQSQGRGA